MERYDDTNKPKTFEIDEIKRKPLRAHLLEHMIDYSQYSSYHGISNIFRTHNILVKIIWVMFFLASAAMCFYLIFESISGYIAYDVTTKIVVIPSQPSSFPQVNFYTIIYLFS